MNSLIGILAILLSIVTITTAGKSTSEHQIVTIIPKEEPKLHGIFQKHGRQLEHFEVPKGSSPLLSSATHDDDPDASSITSMQLPLQLTSVRRHFKHVVASILTLFLFGSIIYCWKFPKNQETTVGPVVLMISVVCYFVEASNSSTARYLRNSLTPDGVDEYLDSLKVVLPRVVWEMECFHYQTVERVDYSSSSSNDSDDGEQSQPEVRTETEKVVTHQASAEYVFQSCKDETDRRSLARMLEGGGTERKESVGLPKQFTKISLDKLLLFANDETYYDYVDQESHFRNLHQNHDVYHEFSSRLILDGYLPKILVVNHSLGGAGTGMIKNLWYWIFSCLGLTVPYRIWFSQHCSNTEVTITKEVKGRMFPSG